MDVFILNKITKCISKSNGSNDVKSEELRFPGKFKGTELGNCGDILCFDQLDQI